MPMENSLTWTPQSFAKMAELMDGDDCAEDEQRSRKGDEN